MMYCSARQRLTHIERAALISRAAESLIDIQKKLLLKECSARFHYLLDAPLFKANAPHRPEPTYHVSVEETDELVNVIFTKSSLNPSFFMNGRNEYASEYLEQSNKFRPKKSPAQSAKSSKKS